jgi:hypothetical protein
MVQRLSDNPHSSSASIVTLPKTAESIGVSPDSDYGVRTSQVTHLTPKEKEEMGEGTLGFLMNEDGVSESLYYI